MVEISSPGIPVIALTPYTMPGDEARARAVGCDDYVAKPISTEELPGIVKRNLKGNLS